MQPIIVDVGILRSQLALGGGVAPRDLTLHIGALVHLREALSRSGAAHLRARLLPFPTGKRSSTKQREARRQPCGEGRTKGGKHLHLCRAVEVLLRRRAQQLLRNRDRRHPFPTGDLRREVAPKITVQRSRLMSFFPSWYFGGIMASRLRSPAAAAAAALLLAAVVVHVSVHRGNNTGYSARPGETRGWA